MCAETVENVTKGVPADTAKIEAELKQTKTLSAGLFATTVALLVSTVALAVTRDQSTTIYEKTIVKEVLVDVNGNALGAANADPTLAMALGENPCAGKKPDLPNVQCVIDAIEQTPEQSAANVTKGYNGKRNTTATPLTVPYYQAGLCPVNVHWHLGAEHYSLGEFDETGTLLTNIFCCDRYICSFIVPARYLTLYLIFFNPQQELLPPKSTTKSAKDSTASTTTRRMKNSPRSTTGSTALVCKLERPTKFTGPTLLPVTAAPPSNTKLLSMMVSSARTISSPILPHKLVSKDKSLLLSMTMNTTTPTSSVV